MTASQFKQRREHLGLTMGELAEDLCVSISAVSLWESGQRRIPESISKLFSLLYGFPYVSSEPSPAEDAQPFLFEFE